MQFSQQSFDVPLEDVDQLKETTEAAVAGSGVELQFTGPVIQNSEPPATGTSELLGLIAAIIILLIMLGSAVAAGLPIVLALVSVGLGLSLLTLGAAVTNFNTITPVLATMLGLGVGIDYALFILTRFRQGIHDGLSGEDAAAGRGRDRRARGGVRRPHGGDLDLGPRRDRARLHHQAGPGRGDHRRHGGGRGHHAAAGHPEPAGPAHRQGAACRSRGGGTPRARPPRAR